MTGVEMVSPPVCCKTTVLIATNEGSLERNGMVPFQCVVGFLQRVSDAYFAQSNIHDSNMNWDLMDRPFRTNGTLKMSIEPIIKRRP